MKKEIVTLATTELGILATCVEAQEAIDSSPLIGSLEAVWRRHRLIARKFSNGAKPYHDRIDRLLEEAAIPW